VQLHSRFLGDGAISSKLFPISIFHLTLIGVDDELRPFNSAASAVAPNFQLWDSLIRLSQAKIDNLIGVRDGDHDGETRQETL
jgi:hypothetical protein